LRRFEPPVRTFGKLEFARFPSWKRPISEQKKINFRGRPFIIGVVRTKKDSVPVFALCSRQSARQFVRAFAGIKPSPYWFHQTLSFGNPKPDVHLAHARLKMLLNRLEKIYPEMSCIWVSLTTPLNWLTIQRCKRQVVA
jgi:hypothetical protein